MSLKKAIFFLQFCLINSIKAQVNSSIDATVLSWIKSTGYGYNGILTNIDKIEYSSNYVIIHTNGIPSYSIGQLNNNSDVPIAQNLTFKLYRNFNTKNLASIKIKAAQKVGILINGVSIYNSNDRQSYLNLGVWERNTNLFNSSKFDVCSGTTINSQNKGEYYVSSNPICLYDSKDNSKHSPLLGWALDGFPIYGLFGYSNPLDPSSSLKKMSSSYRLRPNITNRNKLSNGTFLSTIFAAPNVSSSWPLGSFQQDYEFIEGLGDLDANNGRKCKTPDYPNPIYAYFFTESYPYTIGPYFYGDVINQNLIINESTTTYFEITEKEVLKSTKSNLLTTPQIKQTDWISILIGFSTIAINSLVSSLVTFSFGST